MSDMLRGLAQKNYELADFIREIEHVGCATPCDSMFFETFNRSIVYCVQPPTPNRYVFNFGCNILKCGPEHTPNGFGVSQFEMYPVNDDGTFMVSDPDILMIHQFLIGYSLKRSLCDLDFIRGLLT